MALPFPLLLALALPCAPPPPDVLTAGSRGVVHELVLVDSPHFAEYELFAAPVRGFGGETRIVPGEPFRFSSKYGTRLYALPMGAWAAGAPPAESPLDWSGAALAVASGDIPVRETNSVPQLSPVQSVTTQLRITDVSGGALRLEVVDEDVELDAGLIALVVGVAVLGLAGLVAGFVLVARRRRGAAAA